MPDKDLKFAYINKENFIKAMKELMDEYNITLKYYEIDHEFVFMNNEIYVPMYEFLK